MATIENSTALMGTSDVTPQPKVVRAYSFGVETATQPYVVRNYGTLPPFSYIAPGTGSSFLFGQLWPRGSRA